jgi:hypothetical protein
VPFRSDKCGECCTLEWVKWSPDRFSLFGMALILCGIGLAVIFSSSARIDPDPSVWLTPNYYSQFLPVAVSAMLLLCGVFLVFARSKANFNLAVFGHTASEEAIFNWLGFTKTSLPLWALWIFFILAIVMLWISYTNVLNQKRLSVSEALFGIIFGALLVILPNL